MVWSPDKTLVTTTSAEFLFEWPVLMDRRDVHLKEMEDFAEVNNSRNTRCLA